MNAFFSRVAKMAGNDAGAGMFKSGDLSGGVGSMRQTAGTAAPTMDTSLLGQGMASGAATAPGPYAVPPIKSYREILDELLRR